uniref:Uncharacterized protein n=1 Tax=Timema cristinae TaxID=61476 RepID=A0A7R9CPD9_TIMCR|nr:unnamed protein product [Timema cristinae]
MKPVWGTIYTKHWYSSLQYSQNYKAMISSSQENRMEHKGTRLPRTCYSTVCGKDEEQGYFGPVPMLPVTERLGTSLLRTCYSMYLIRGPVTKRNSSFRLSGTGCECDARGVVTNEQVVISQSIPSNDALLAHCDELKMKNEELEMKNKELTTENKHLCSKLLSRQTRDVGCSPIVGPAASIVHPPPQGLGLQPAQGLTFAVWRILTICLLFPTSWETLLQTIICPSWRNSQSLFFEKLLQAAACGNAESAETPQVLGGAPEDMGPSPMAYDYLAATNSRHQDLLPTIHIPDTRETFRGTCEPLRDDVNETITITLPCKGMVCVEDAVQEVVTSESCEMFEEAVSPIFSDTHSPVPHSPLLYTTDDIAVKKGATFSDCGYESLDSPYSQDSTNCGLTDLWNESFSNLFPSLI